MIAFKKEGVLQSKTNLEFENECVLDPAVILDGEIVHVFNWAVQKENHSIFVYRRLDELLTIAEQRDKPNMVSEFELK